MLYQSDEVLLKKASKGEEAAFIALYERYKNRVFSFSYRMLNSIEKAEDVTQDCFLFLIKNPSRFDSKRSSFITYIYSIARNLSLKCFNSHNYELSVSDFEEDYYFSPALELKQVLDKELSLVIEKAFSRLPSNQKEVLILTEYEELSLSEIAIITTTNIGVVKSRLHRGRENLRKLLLEYYSNNNPFTLVRKI
ncbi:MAG: RNA polymerase sigma factor [Acidobacteria bacterium]|nr:RNA polymerase sigma factor [Acidobacteriota bacterium]